MYVSLPVFQAMMLFISFRGAEEETEGGGWGLMGRQVPTLTCQTVFIFMDWIDSRLVSGLGSLHCIPR